MELEEKEICPKCKKKFRCLKSNKCWCFEIGLDSDQLDHLGDQYKNCLCPDCLKEYIDQNKSL